MAGRGTRVADGLLGFFFSCSAIARTAQFSIIPEVDLRCCPGCLGSLGNHVETFIYGVWCVPAAVKVSLFTKNIGRVSPAEVEIIKVAVRLLRRLTWCAFLGRWTWCALFYP